MNHNDVQWYWELRIQPGCSIRGFMVVHGYAYTYNIYYSKQKSGYRVSVIKWINVTMMERTKACARYKHCYSVAANFSTS